LVECAFYILIHRDKHLSDGEVHEPQAWEWLDDALYEFGGATRSLALNEGFCRDPDTGQRVYDRSRRYEVALPRRQVAKLRALLRDACGLFAQKCIYLSVGGSVEFVEGRRHENR
jgi:hypothetical protein